MMMFNISTKWMYDIRISKFVNPVGGDEVKKGESLF